MNENKTIRAALDALPQIAPHSGKIILALIKEVEKRDDTIAELQKTIAELRKELDEDNPGMADK